MKVTLLSRNVDNFERCGFENLIDKLITLSSIDALVGRTIKLNREQWTKPGITNHEINVLGTDTIEVCLPAGMTPVCFDKVRKPDLCQNRVISEDFSKNIVKIFFSLRKQESLSKIRLEGCFHWHTQPAAHVPNAGPPALLTGHLSLITSEIRFQLSAFQLSPRMLNV